MRISTPTLYERGIASIQDQTGKLLKLNEQIAAMRRVLTPADDPVAAARAMEVSQSISTNEQYRANQKSAENSLALEESTLGQVENLLQRARELAVDAGNGAYDNTNRGYIAKELRILLQDLVSQGNATDGNGSYLFSGYQGGTTPFSVSSATPPVAYNGDQGQRQLQIDASRRVATSDSGAEIFMNVKSGNGVFTTSAPLANASGQVTSTNLGTGVITKGVALDPTKWNATGNTKDYRIVFAVDNTTTPAVTSYDIVTNVATTVNGVPYAAGWSMLTGAQSTVVASATGGPTFPRTYTAGEAISFKTMAWDLGIEVTVEGVPAGNPPIGALVWPPPTGAAGVDYFKVQAHSNESVFKTLDDLATLLETPVRASPTLGDADRAMLSNGLNTALTNLSNDMDRISTIRASVGARLKEVESAGGLAEDLGIQYQKHLSELQDLDFAKAVSDLTQRQVGLEAAQKAYTRVTGMSLFNFL
jgi:flagellar hook-associated protein 3